MLDPQYVTDADLAEHFAEALLDLAQADSSTRQILRSRRWHVASWFIGSYQ